MTPVNFGTTSDGSQALLYTIENKHGMRASFSDYGASVVRLEVPDRHDRLRDVVLGYDCVRGYEQDCNFFGAVIGRNANRISNAEFQLDHTQYRLEYNEQQGNLHSGSSYYSKRFWNCTATAPDKVVFTLYSPNQDQGFPGNLQLQVAYTLTADNQLWIEYEAVSDAETIVNLTNHSYFNLNGAGDILQHFACIDADYYTRTNHNLIPIGALSDVTGTPMDFRQWKRIGSGITDSYLDLQAAGGYDHNYVLNRKGVLACTAQQTCAAQLCAQESGIVMKVFTDMPGLQFYTGNSIQPVTGKCGQQYAPRSGVCFETQYYPDAVHQRYFPATVLHANDIYHTTTIYQFGRNDERCAVQQ